jgi:peroxiredoxin
MIFNTPAVDVQGTKRSLRFCIIALVLATSTGLYAQDGQKAAEKLVVGKTLPDISLQDLSGKNVRLADYAKSGKITLLSFWATWCVPCKKELTNMADLYESWKKKYNVQIVAVSIDDAKSSGRVKQYMDDKKWNYQVLLDADQKLKRELNIQSVPFMVAVDANGKIAFTHSGYNDGEEYLIEDALVQLTKK